MFKVNILTIIACVLLHAATMVPKHWTMLSFLEFRANNQNPQLNPNPSQNNPKPTLIQTNIELTLNNHKSTVKQSMIHPQPTLNRL